MAHRTENGILETSATLGTGALTLDGAVTGHARFSAKMNVGDTCHYLVQAVDAVGRPSGEFERGRGTLTAANTLQRTTVVESSNGNAAVNFTATNKLVSLTILAPTTNLQIRADWLEALGAVSKFGAVVTGGAYTLPSIQAFAANPTFNAALSNVHHMAAMTANVTSIAVTGQGDGQTVQIRFQQDSVGGRSVTLNPAFKVSGYFQPGPNQVTWLIMTWVNSASRWEGAWSGVPA